LVISLNMAGSVPDAAELVITDPCKLASSQAKVLALKPSVVYRFIRSNLGTYSHEGVKGVLRLRHDRESQHRPICRSRNTSTTCNVAPHGSMNLRRLRRRIVVPQAERQLKMNRNCRNSRLAEVKALMHSYSAAGVLALLFAGSSTVALAQAPVVNANGVVNGASNTTTVVAGSEASIFGTNLASSTGTFGACSRFRRRLTEPA
jgi:hypothetical protein